jgi:hypothetical protein
MKTIATNAAVHLAADKAREFLSTKRGKTIGIIALVAAVGAALFLRSRRSR